MNITIIITGKPKKHYLSSLAKFLSKFQYTKPRRCRTGGAVVQRDAPHTLHLTHQALTLSWNRSLPREAATQS